MINPIKKISSVWGAVATGPAIWGVTSILAMAGVITLTFGSPAFIIAVTLTALAGVVFGIFSGINLYNDHRSEKKMEARLKKLEARDVELESFPRAFEHFPRQEASPFGFGIHPPLFSSGARGTAFPTSNSDFRHVIPAFAGMTCG